MTIELTTGVGRLVWGNPGKSSDKLDQKKQKVLKDGQPIPTWACGIAFPKDQFLATIWPALAQEAGTIFPAGVPSNFSWKWKDGDGVDSAGKPYNTREGYAGCYVLTVATEAFAPPIVKLNAQGNGYESVPAEGIKTGDYVVVALNIQANMPKDRTHTPGLYVNPRMFELVGYGTPIFSGPDAMTLLGGQRHALPAGASMQPMQAAGAPSMPMGGQQMQMPGQQMPGNGAPPAMGGYPAPGQNGVTPAYPSNVPPANDFVPNAMGMPQMPGQQPQQMQMPGQQPQQMQMPGQQPQQMQMPGNR